MAGKIDRAKAFPTVFENHKGSDMNSLEKNKDSFKTTKTGQSCDSGSTDSELSEARSKLYKAAVNNSGSPKGDHALQNR